MCEFSVHLLIFVGGFISFKRMLADNSGKFLPTDTAEP